MTGFALAVDEDIDLVLRESWTVESLHHLIQQNLERLRRWEPWAAGDQTIEGLRAFTSESLQAWAEGRNVPTAIRYQGALVGVVGARVNRYDGTAELGYWIDASYEGRGLVARSVQGLLGYLFDGHEIFRAEIRTSVDNQRSRSLAQRLGFLHEGTLRSALPIKDHRDDVAVYGLPKPSR